ncbi:rho guanine nucleotide exchange factor 11-like isoform X3 [Glandiceps talaboti]
MALTGGSRFPGLVGLSQDTGEKKQAEKDKSNPSPEKEFTRRPSSVVMETVQDFHGAQLIQRCVIVQRDEKGYGLTVSGDNPVFVQSVKDHGAAYKAGVQQGDRIIKVNGTLVTQSNHIEVVKLIKSGSYVALTLLGRPPGSNYPPLPPPHIPLQPQLSQSGRPEVTGPKPAGPEKDEELRLERINVMQQMLDQEMELYQKTKEEYVKTNSEKLRKELEGATTRVKVLEQQLHNLTGISSAAKDTQFTHPTQDLPQQSHHIGDQADFSSTDVPPLPPDPPPPLPTQSPIAPYSVKHYPSPTSPPEGVIMDPSPQFENYEVSIDHIVPGHAEMSVVEEDDQIPTVGVPTSAPESKAPISENKKKLLNVLKRRRKSDTEAWTSNIEIKHRSPTWLPGGAAHHTRQHSSPDTVYPRDQSDMPTHGAMLKRNLSDAADKDYKRAHLSGGGSDTRLSSGNISQPDDQSTSDHEKVQKDSDSDQDMTPERRESYKPHRFEAMEPQEVDLYSPEEHHHHQDVDTERTQSDDVLTSPIQGSPSEEERVAESNSSELRTATVNTVEQYSQPYSQSYSHATVNVVQPPPTQQIISMEDDDFAEEELERTSLNQYVCVQTISDHGPFNSLEELEKKPAHMAVFIHYVISNSDPSSMFLYLVTDSYSTGSLKEMKKWAYEIFSTFLAHSAPLQVHIENTAIIGNIQETIAQKNDNQDMMRNIFVAPRSLAADEVRELLADFRSKRSLGLGNLYGDQQLEDNLDKSKEAQIIEHTLMPHLDRYAGPEAEKEPKNLAMASCLTTFMKQNGVKVQNNSTLERLPSFTQRDKSKFRIKNKKAVQVRGHHFVLTHYQMTAYCGFCGELLWGIGNQGYQCQSCDYNVHKSVCLEQITDMCPGKKKKDRGSRLKQMMPQRRTSENNPKASMYSPPPFNTVKEAQRLREVFTFSNQSVSTHSDHQSVSTPITPQYVSPSIQPLQDKEDDDIAYLRSGGGKTVHKIVEELEELQDESKEKNSPITPRSDSPDVLMSDKVDTDRLDRSKVTRSGSLRSHDDLKRKPHGQEKRSKSGLLRPTKSVDDVDVDQQSVVTTLNNSRGSSSSSISVRSQESPSLSMETVTTHRVLDDSDIETEQDTPNWQNTIDRDILKSLKPREVKRQEVINELFHTEKNHVRNLKILDEIFMKPMKLEQVVNSEFLRLLFPNVEELLEMHSALNTVMKKERKTSHVIDEVGDMLLSRFDGEPGQRFKEACAQFCRYQSLALETLKARRKKDDKLEKFLADAESNPICRRLQLKDFIAVVFQRLTKYPLLLENIIKYTDKKISDHSKLSRAKDCSKEILDHVNTAVKEAENQVRLRDIVKKTDRSPFEKSNDPIAVEFRSIDFMARKLLHDGPLTWRLGRAKSIDLHVLLLEDLLVLLQKDDNRYVLKFHSTTTQMMSEQKKNTHSPIVKLSNLLCRNVATDKKAFFLVSTSQLGPQIYELVAGTSSERKTWSDVITRTSEGMKYQGNRRRGAKVVTAPSILPPPPDINEAEEERTEGLMDTEKINEKNKSRSMDNLDTVVIEKALEIKNPPELINPSDIVVINHQANIEKAEALSTPLERLKQTDETLHKALEEKNRILAEILGVPMNSANMESKTPIIEEEKVADSTDLVHELMLHSNRLTQTINEHMDGIPSIPPKESSSPVSRSNRQSGGDWGQHSPSLSLNTKIINISKALTDNLTRLLGALAEEKQERRRKDLEHKQTEESELQNITEEVKTLSISDTESPVIHRHLSDSPNSQIRGSRPNSFLSVGSSSADGHDYEEIEDYHQRESSGEESAQSPCNMPPPESLDASSVSEDTTNLNRSESF